MPPGYYRLLLHLSAHVSDNVQVLNGLKVIGDQLVVDHTGHSAFVVLTGVELEEDIVKFEVLTEEVFVFLLVVLFDILVKTFFSFAHSVDEILKPIGQLKVVKFFLTLTKLKLRILGRTDIIIRGLRISEIAGVALS
jgi:hypothetical protein